MRVAHRPRHLLANHPHSVTEASPTLHPSRLYLALLRRSRQFMLIISAGVRIPLQTCGDPIMGKKRKGHQCFRACCMRSVLLIAIISSGIPVLDTLRQNAASIVYAALHS